MLGPEQVRLFKEAIHQQMATYNVVLMEEHELQLAAYYELLLRWNERLHLIAPCSAEEFAVRHVLESLALLDHLPERATVADIGSGAGLPIIPCLIVRTEITATLFESSQKKSVFLHEVLKTVGALDRATILSKRFEDSSPSNANVITCRALDDFTSKLETLLEWAPAPSTLLLFGGENLSKGLSVLGYELDEFLLPGSKRRFLFKVAKAS